MRQTLPPLPSACAMAVTLSALAALADGETQIVHAERLRLKESDRLQSVCACLRALGAEIRLREA